MNRPFRILRHRWRTVLLISMVTVVAALWVADFRNDSIEPRFRAEAPVTFVDSVEEFEILGGTLLETVETQLEDAQAQAVAINEDVLDEPGYEIEADPSIGRLTFIATGPTVEEAIEQATMMRDRVLAERPFDIDAEINRQIDSTLAQLDTVRDEIAVVSAETSADPEIEEERVRLTTLLAELEAQALQLEQWSRVPPTGEDALTPAQIQSELTQVNLAITDVEGDLAALPPSIDPLSSGATELRALQRQYEEMEIRYQNLLIQRSDLQGLPLVGSVETMERTPSTIPLEVAGLVALIVGLGLAFAVLVATERLLAPVWFPADVSQIPFLPTVVTRPRSGHSWYIRSGSSRRKSSLQAIRSTIRARVPEDEFVVVVAGSGVGSSDIQNLGVDLAAAFASTSVETALIDASFESPTRQPEFRYSSLSISDVVVGAETDDQVHAIVDEAASSHGPLQPELMVVSVGEGLVVPADALAGPRVGTLFDLLRETRDVVVVVCDDIEMPSTQALVDRSDLVLLATAPGAARRSSLIRVAEEMSYRQVDLVGTFLKTPFLQALRRPLGLRERWRRWRSRVAQPVAVERPVERTSPPAGRPTATPSPNATPSLPATPAEAEVGEHKLSSEPPTSYSHSRHLALPDDDAPPVPGSDPAAELSAEIVGEIPDEPVATRPESRNGSARNHPVPEAGASRSILGATEMFDLLQTLDPAEAAPDAERFLVDTVTTLVLAQSDTGLDPVTVSEVREAGFVPLATWKGHPSLASRLRHEFRNELGKKEGGDFEQLLLKALSQSGESADASSIDRWVGRRYFDLHASAEDWEPRVWHVVSPERTISALVSAERLDRSRMESFVDAVIIRAIERLARRRRRKELVGDQAGMEEFDAQIEDARELGLAVAWLIDGTRPEARLWYPDLAEEDQPRGWAPDWSQGIKNNIVPLQRLGILAGPVLTERELRAYEPAG